MLAERLIVMVAVFLYPLNHLRPTDIYFTYGDLVGLLAFLVMALNRRLPLRFYGGGTTLWLASFAFLATGLLLGSMAHDRMDAGLLILMQYSYSVILLPLVLAGRSLEETRQLMMVFAASMVFVVVHGIYLVHFATDPHWRLVSFNGRLRGLLERENDTATMSAIAIVFLIYLSSVGNIGRISAVITIAALGYGIMLTASNTGIGSAAIGVVLLAILSGAFRQLAGMAALAGTVVVATIFLGDQILPETFRERVLPALTSGDLQSAGTFGDRMEVNFEALKIANETLFIGLGADGFRAVSAEQIPVHNLYLLVLSEGGLISLLGLCGLLLTGVGLGINALMHPGRRPQGALTLTIVMTLAATLNAYPHIYARFWHVPLCLAISLSAALPTSTQIERRKKASPDRRVGRRGH